MSIANTSALPAPEQNHLLAAMSPAEQQRLYPHLQLVQMPLGKVLYESGDTMRHVYFPTDCIVSLLYVLENGSSAEISVVGNEGLIGVALFMGGETVPNRAVVQSAGHAYSLAGSRLKEEFHRSGGMQLLLLRYTQALITQMAQTAVCNRHHSVDQQLCRWLLPSLDRLGSNRLVMTQELIANMLGVRREGVRRQLASCRNSGSSATRADRSRYWTGPRSNGFLVSATQWSSGWEDGLYSGRNGPEHCRNVPMGERRRRFFLAIKDGWREGGRDIPVVAQPHSTSRRELDAFLDTVPKDTGLTAGNWASWSLAYHDPLSVDLHVLARQRETGRRTIYYQQHFFGFDGAPTSEFPLPLRLAARLERARGMGLDELDTLGGFVSPPVKQRSVMQELYRRFLLEAGTGPDQLVERTAAELCGSGAGPVLVSIWKDIDSTIEQNGNQIGFALGTEYASRRTLVRPLVPDASALSPDERDWWLRFTFGGSLRFGHAHLFRGEGGLPPQDFYVANRDRSIRARDAFQRGSAALRSYIGGHPDAVCLHPYLAAHERQLRFLSSVYATGANLYEGQRILDRSSRKSIEDDLKREVDSDFELFRRTVQNEIENTQALLELFEQDGDPGMVLLSEETTWGYGANFPDLLRRKNEIMRRRLPEIGAVLRRWFDSEY